VTVCRTTDANAPEAALACSDTAALGFDGNDWASGWIVFAKAGTGANFSAFESALGDFLLMRQPAANVGRSRAAVWSTMAGAQRVAYRGDGMPAGVMATRFFVDYGTVPTPAVGARDPNPLTLSFAGRCLAVAGGTGRVRAYRPTGNTCPTL
ncbi:MAG: hypothetical protein ACXW13_01720, partial [Burkholderiaceae bacterium]